MCSYKYDILYKLKWSYLENGLKAYFFGAKNLMTSLGKLPIYCCLFCVVIYRLTISNKTLDQFKTRQTQGCV